MLAWLQSGVASARVICPLDADALVVAIAAKATAKANAPTPRIDLLTPRLPSETAH
ncbi:MAG: hypothetical protein ACTHLH_11645 [Solirubrobacterales bacterium]